MELRPVLAHQVDEMWDGISHLVDSVTERASMYTTDEIRGHLIRGTAQLWLAVSGGLRAICITQICTYKRKECNILVCAGDGARAWVHLLEQIGDWARAEGCEAMTLTGRKGWKKLLPHWRQSAVELEFLL